VINIKIYIKYIYIYKYLIAVRIGKGFHYDKKFVCQNEDFQHALIRNFLRKVNTHELNDSDAYGCN
jgi:hypothetical protein